MTYREQLETEARAKIFWGDSSESVRTHLESQGVNHEEAQSILSSIIEERAAAVRADGKKRIVVGSLLLLVPFISYFIFTAIGILPLKIFGVAVAIGFWGGWKLVRGTMNILSPKLDTSDLSDSDA